jgi:hypothetical protein
MRSRASTFQVQVYSGSSTAPNVNTDQTPNTMSINVTPVNDAPVSPTSARIRPYRGRQRGESDPDNNASVSDANSAAAVTTARR